MIRLHYFIIVIFKMGKFYLNHSSFLFIINQIICMVLITLILFRKRSEYFTVVKGKSFDWGNINTRSIMR